MLQMTDMEKARTRSDDDRLKREAALKALESSLEKKRQKKRKWKSECAQLAQQVRQCLSVLMYS